MTVEIWKDIEGFRLQFEDNEFDLSADGLEKLIESLATAQDRMKAGDYRNLQLDLPEDEDGKL